MTEYPHRALNLLVQASRVSPPLREAVAEVEAYLAQFGPEETRHLIRFRPDGWMVQHPISERIDGSLFDCDFVWDGSEYPEGTYVLYMDELGNMNIGNPL